LLPVTMTVGDSHEAAGQDIGNFVNNYFPELSKRIDWAQWGPVQH